MNIPKREGAQHIRLIQTIVARELNLPLDKLLGRERTSHLSFGRQVAIYLTRDLLPGCSTICIGEYFNRDHSTVINASDVIKSRLRDRPFELLLEHIKQIVNAEIADSDNTFAQVAC